jgi:hypothetical protein
MPLGGAIPWAKRGGSTATETICWVGGALADWVRDIRPTDSRRPLLELEVEKLEATVAADSRREENDMADDGLMIDVWLVGVVDGVEMSTSLLRRRRLS